MGVDAKGLEATVRDWNKMVKQGKDTAFGRQITGGIGEGPYYIVEQKVRYQTTLGGLRAAKACASLTRAASRFRVSSVLAASWAAPTARTP